MNKSTNSSTSPKGVPVYSPYIIDAKGYKVDAGKAGEIFPQPVTAVMYYTEKTRDGVFKIMPVVKAPPADAPYKNDAKMEFRVDLGGGSADPVLQTQETGGYYSTTLKLVNTPGKNRINSIGTVTASVPSYDAQGNETRTDKALAASFPIEIWGLKLTVPAYQQLVLNSEGYPVAEVEFNYDILPADYQVIPASLAVEVFERSATGSETLLGLVPADSNKKIILSKGMAKFDVNNTYYAQVVLNRGPEEVRSEKIPLINAALIPDYNRDGKIDKTDRERAERGDKFYFWINDDDDGGETDGSDIPGDKMLTSINLDYENAKVDGIRDLIDFFPVHLDIKSLLYAFDPAKYAYKLRSEAESLNFVLTDLEALHAGYYLRGDDNNLEIPVKLGNADTKRVQADGSFLDYAFLDKIKTGGKGVVLIEGRKASTKPLELKIYDSLQNNVLTLSFNLSLDGVEQMFRHENLTRAVKADAEFGPDSKYGVASRDKALNCPDVECLSVGPQNIKNFVFLHGYNVNGQEARGWQAEIFKRMFWSGSRARFWGVTWDRWDTQIPIINKTRNYHINVRHAFNTAPALNDFIRDKVDGDVTIAAHSLGNMIVSAMLTDNSAVWDASGKIKHYFMIDAAVAMEAYDGATTQEKDPASAPEVALQKRYMDHQEWAGAGYHDFLFASEWYQLFASDDARSKLTWRDRFKKRPAKATYFNFYSSGEQVLGTLPYEQAS